MKYVWSTKPAHIRFLTYVVLFLGLLAVRPSLSTTRAQSTRSSGPDTPPDRVRPTGERSDDQKSPGRAVFYSTAGTVLLAPAGGVGFVIGPALGHFYAGNERQAWTGITLRTASLGAAGMGGILALGAPRTGWMLLTLGLLVTGGSTLYDTVTAWHSARNDHDSNELRSRPTSTGGPHGNHRGLTVRVTF